jgi:myosin heavy subunit
LENRNVEPTEPCLASLAPSMDQKNNEIEKIANALVREYLNKKDLKKTLSVMYKEQASNLMAPSLTPTVESRQDIEP